jgi:cytochrome d ubiquinol oxidase subunit II
VCAYLAAVLLTREAVVDNELDVADYFRARALVAGVVTGSIAVSGVVILAADAPSLFDGLTTARGLVSIATSAAGGLTSIWLVYTRRFVAARPAAAMAVVAILWGWGAGQYPWVLPESASIGEFAASDPVLWALVIAFAAAGALVVPSLVWLYRLTQSRSLAEGDARPDSTQAMLGRTKT